LLTKEGRSLDIVSVKKEAKLSAEVKVGKFEEDLRCNTLLTVCPMRRRLADEKKQAGDKR